MATQRGTRDVSLATDHLSVRPGVDRGGGLYLKFEGTPSLLVVFIENKRCKELK